MAPLVHHIAIPNPFFEGKNQVYLVATDPVTLIDTGVATKMAFDALESGLKEHGLLVRDVKRVVLTHKHIDHLGNAWRIQQASGAEIWIHESECDAVAKVDPEGIEFVNVLSRRLEEWQAPDRVDKNAFPHMMPQWEIEPAEAHALVDGQRLEFDCGQLEVIHTPGHTVGSICLRMGSLLFTGDHVLLDISPNIGGGDLQHRGLLQMFFDSLERIKAQADGVVALPGHGESFTTLPARCDVLVKHHQQRLEQIRLDLRDGPMTVYELAVKLFGKMDGFHRVLGCAEAHSHLEWLVDRRDVEALPDGFGFRLT